MRVNPNRYVPITKNEHTQSENLRTAMKYFVNILECTAKQFDMSAARKGCSTWLEQQEHT